MKLSKGQVLEDFYGQTIEKGQILKKQDHEILSQFIKGLPDKLAFFVRAGTHKDSTSTLAAAKMGKVYRNREDDNILVAAAKPAPSSPSEPKKTWAFDLQKQVQELTKVVSELKLQPKASQNHTPQSQQDTTRRKFRPQHDFSTPSQNQQSRRVQICYKCRAPGHITGYVPGNEARCPSEIVIMYM
jgi:hypothetical protein